MLTLHRAPWVLPIITPAIADGAVIVDQSKIVAVGPYADLRHLAYDRASHHEAAILMPALVNGHCHLELSAFAGLARQPVEPGNMPAWITELLAARASKVSNDDRAICNATLAGQYADGVIDLVDIGNAHTPLYTSCEGIEINYFTELLGLSQQGTDFGLQILLESDLGHHFTCHAPYSTSRVLLQAVKKRSRTAGQLFPIHVAESLDEVEFLRSGQGRFRSFLEDRGVWDGSFVAPGSGAVEYLADLALIDDKTLCVHCVHLLDDEIELLARKKAKVCLCPGSNRFLGVGRAEVGKMVAAGIRPCLGTDSLASNPELSMWREMSILAQDNPGLSPALVVAMATLHGAEAIGDSSKGCLQVGSTSHFLTVSYDGSEPFEFLVEGSAPKEVNWL